MTDSSPNLRPNSPPPSSPDPNTNPAVEIPIEFVTEEEMTFLEAALTASRASASSSFPISSSISSSSELRSIQSISLLSKRRFCIAGVSDIEDSGDLGKTQKKNRLKEPFLRRLRKNRGLMVTDVTSTDWCEKQVEYSLQFGKKETTRAMEAGQARHKELEEEVAKKFRVHTKTAEDRWAIKLINFITGANQLLLEGLTRELQLIGFAEGVWMVGIIDEIRMSGTDTDRKPMIVDIKTRQRDTLPSGPQKRNGRLQLMCYKYLWDTLVAGSFPAGQFFSYFSLNRYYILSEEIREKTAKSGYPVQTLEDVVRQYTTTFSTLPLAHDQLVLKYESQKDQSVLGEDQFAYDSDWLNKQLQVSLEFWLGKREANYTPEEERWKCQYCKFKSVCPGNPKLDKRPDSPSSNPMPVSPDKKPDSPKPDAIRLS